MKEVPFYSQIVNWRGEDSGFPNEEEIQKWENNCCGIACARMVIDFFTGKKPTYWELLQIGLKKGAYIEAGWIHKGLVSIAEDFGIEGTTHRNKSIDDLVSTLKKGSVCIVSATAGFRGGQINKDTGLSYRKGGHLVVAFDVGNKSIVCNHPSSYDPMNKQKWEVELDRWEASFSRNYMEFSRLARAQELP